MQWLSLFIEEMCCPAEVSLIQSELSRKPGIGGMEFDLFSQRLNVQHDPAIVTPNGVRRFLAEFGMTAHPWRDVREMTDFQSRSQRLRTLTTWLSGLSFLAGIIFHAVQFIPVDGALDWITSETTVYTRVLYGLSILLGFLFVGPAAIRAVLRGRADMNLLMFVAVVGALVLGEWFEASMVTFLFSMSVWLEQWSMKQVQTAMRGHLQQSPLIARCRKSGHGQTVELPIEQVDVGSLVEVWAGEIVPLDGRVVKGESYVNEAVMTGESLAVGKQEGDFVYAGSTNIESTLHLETTCRVNESTLTRTMTMVAEAQTKKAGIQTTVERFAEIYTPLIMLAALLLMVIPPVIPGQAFDSWFHLALVVLVIACPCALVISTPVATTVALTRGIREGVLIRGSRFIEVMADVKTVCFDKTGTLTEGNPRVVSLWCKEESRRDEVLELAATLEQQSLHPLAKAIVTYAESQGIVPLPAPRIETVFGQGVRGNIGGRQCWIGSLGWARELSEDVESLSDQHTDFELPSTTVVVGIEREVLGTLRLEDPIREVGQKLVGSLRQAGIRQTQILSGDASECVESVQRETGMDIGRGDLLPEQKLAWIEQLSESTSVAMVGDGVNDAPALARADVGIAMGAMGLEVVLKSADVSLMNNDLNKIPWLIRFSRKVRSAIRWNIFLAVAAKVTVLGLAFSGFAYLWLAVLADTGATLLVVLNALRLLGSQHD